MFFILEAVEKQRGIVSLAGDWESKFFRLFSLAIFAFL